MPKKIRQLKAMLKKAGFASRPGKGSHTVWSHAKLAGRKLTMPGHDSEDARRYLEKIVKQAIEESEKEA